MASLPAEDLTPEPNAPETGVSAETEAGAAVEESPQPAPTEPGFLRAAPVFGNLIASKRKDIEAAFERRTHAAGDTIFAAGDYDGREAMVVVDGRVQLTAFDAAQDEMASSVLEPGAIFGLEQCFAASPTGAETVCATASEKSDVAYIGAEELFSLADDNKELAREFISYFAQKLVDRQGESAVGPEARIVSELMNHMEPDPVARGGWRIAKTPKHRDIAQKAGVDDAAVATVIARLIHDGLAERDYPGLVILNYDGLRRLAGRRS